MRNTVKKSTRCVTGVPKGEKRVIRSEVILREKNEIFQIDEDNP